MPLGIRRRISVSVTASLLFAGSGAVAAQGVIPGVGPMTVNTAVAGSQPTPVVNATTNYSAILVFPGQMKVVAQLNANMPAGTTLGVKVTGPAGTGTSLGTVNLDISQRDIVIATIPAFYNNVNIAYTFTANVSAGVLPSTSRTVTFTLLTYP
jgi:hypothetical protein